MWKTWTKVFTLINIDILENIKTSFILFYIVVYDFFLILLLILTNEKEKRSKFLFK